MAIHALNKGKEGEREVVRILNEVINEVLEEIPLTKEASDHLKSLAQRNQNQSAVGGGDIQLLGLSIEVKRQETLSIEAWWKQATTSAARNHDIPILIYRQNQKKWNIVMDMWVPIAIQNTSWTPVRAQMNLDDFKRWFKAYVIAKINNAITHGDLGRV